MAIALSKLDHIQTTQSMHTGMLGEIKTGINTHMSSVAKDMSSSTTYLKSIAETNKNLVASAKWQVTVPVFVVVVLLLGGIIFFREMGDGGKAKLSTTGMELEKGSQKKPD